MLPSNIIITGASSGLGSALALAYARKNITLGLMGRHTQRLEQIADECRSLGAHVETASIDVTDSHAMHAWISSFDTRSPVDLCIANAGISAGSGGGGETVEQITHLFDVNVFGVIHTIHPLIERMKARKHGHLALVSSIAGFRGLPTAPAYSATKATIRYYGQALRGLLFKDNIQVSVICPGFIKTPLTDVNPFPMPFIMSAEKAARIIKRKLACNKKLIAFPLPLVIMAHIQNIMPECIMNRIYSRLPAKPSE